MSSSGQACNRFLRSAILIARTAADLLTRPPILVVFAAINAMVVFVSAAAYVWGVGSPVAGADSKVVVGDYLAFLTGAEILARGDGDQIYDMELQRQVQQDLAGTALPQWQPYVNPPLLAMLLRPLAALPFAEGFRAFAVSNTVVGLIGLFALAKVLPRLGGTRTARLTLVALCASFHVLALSMPGRQNTSITLALLCAMLWALQGGRSVLAGLFLGMLGYKPQYLVFLLAMLAWRRQWKVVGVAAAVVLAQYLIASAAVSPGWPLRYLSALAEYRVLEAAQNASTHFSLIAFFTHWLGGDMGRTAAALALAVTALTFVRFAPRVRAGDEDFPLLLAMTVVAGMLASPHLQYYDFGLLVLPAAVALDAQGRRAPLPSLGARVAAATVYVGSSALFEARNVFGFQPLTLVAVGLFAWLCLLARRSHANGDGLVRPG